MENNNKILTISYGTFSCSLEGFEDSFGALKAIAEYFRDLASDDQYFGAESPQPETDILARIVEREVTLGVEAYNENGAIVLRAKDQSTAPASIAPIVAAVATPVAAEIVAVTDEVQPPEVTPTEIPEVALEQQATTDAAENNLDNITVEEVAADKEPEALVADDVAADLVPVEEFPGDADLVAREMPTTDNEESPDASIELKLAEVSDVADEMPEVAAAPEAEQMNDFAPVADGSSIAAKLERIRAVVSHSDDVVEDNGYVEDEHASDLVPNPEDSIVSAFGLEIDDIAEEEKSLAADPEEDLDGSGYRNLFTKESNDEAQGDETSTVESASIEDNVAAFNAQLIDVNRNKLETTIAEDEIESVKDDTTEVDQNPLLLSTSLSVEEEADLQRELAEVTADTDEKGDTTEATDEDQVDTDDHHGAKLLTEAGNTDDDLSRLMAVTNSQMDEPETSQRRDAFSHLRAAVAATKAEKTLRNDDKGDSTEAYRDDLASVVKPSRPEQTDASAERPAEASPTPLKLVAEQRIDVNEERDSSRPRRVATDVLQNGSATIEEVTGGFVEFASNAGATQLPDLLEAAASYMAFVEGREQFSRPQLMHMVRLVELDNFSREDGLRSFGKLLRSGKLEKIRGGRFTVSDEIGFKPDPNDTRAAG